MHSSQSPIKGSGVLYPNSRVAIADVSDGTSATLMIGERSRNLTDAVWTGVLGISSPTLPLCTKEGWPVESCVRIMVLLMGRSGPASDIVSGSIPVGTPRITRGQEPMASGAGTPADANSCSATALSGSSRKPWDRKCSKRWRRDLAARSSGVTSIESKRTKRYVLWLGLP